MKFSIRESIPMPFRMRTELPHAIQVEPFEMVYSFMPVMDGVTDYFDYRRGLTETGWENLAGGNDAFFIGMKPQTDGSAGVYGHTGSYGQFASPYTPERTVYAVFRTDPIGLVSKNAHILGACGTSIHRYTQGAMFTIQIEGYAQADTIGSDQWGIGIPSSVTSETYHVAALTRTTSGLNTLYVDGAQAGTLQNAVAYGDNWGIGVVVDRSGIISNDMSYSALQQIKFIALSSEAHTADEIAENSAWLYQKFCG